MDPLSQFYASNILILMWLQIVIFLSLLFVNRKHILQEFRKIDKRYLYILLVFVIFSAIIYINHVALVLHFKTPTLTAAKGFYTNNLNFFYNDGESLKAILDARNPYPWGVFYPFLLSITFQILGPESQFIHLLDVIVFSGFLISIFLLFYVLFRDEKTSLLVSVLSSAAFFYTLIFRSPGEQPELLFLMITLSFMFMFISLRKNTRNLYLLFMISLLLMMETRVETGVLVIVFIAGIFIYRRVDIRKIYDFWIKKIFPAFVLILLFSPIFITHSASHYLPIENQTISYDIARITNLLSGDHLQDPLSDISLFMNNFFYLWSTGIFLLLIPFILIGLLFMLKYDKKVCFLFLMMFILHNLIFLLWNNGYLDRYAFTTIIPYLIIMGFSFPSILKIKKLRKYKKYVQIIFFVFAFSILAFSMNFLNSVDSTSPYNFDELQEDLYNFTKSLDDRNVNLMVFDDWVFASKIEFVTMRNVFVFCDLIFERYANTSHTYGYFRGGMDFNDSLRSEKQGMVDSLFYDTLKRINSDPDLKNELRGEILIGETYIIDDLCSPSKYSEEAKGLALNIFKYTVVSEGECIVIYRLD